MNLTALLALESTVIESIWARCDFGKQHPGFALRTTRPLDVGEMRRSYGLILGHRVSLHAGGSVTELSVTGNSQGVDGDGLRMARQARCAMVKIDHFRKLSRRHSGMRLLAQTRNPAKQRKRLDSGFEPSGRASREPVGAPD